MRPRALRTLLFLAFAGCATEKEAPTHPGDAQAGQSADASPAEAGTLLGKDAEAPGDARVGADAGAPADAQQASQDTGSQPTGYALCDGSTNVRLAVASVGGGPLGPLFDFTNPYGHSFLFISGQCEFLLGGTSYAHVIHGTLSAERAHQLEGSLQLDLLPLWSAHEDAPCPDAGYAYVQSAEGHGGCSCGCDANGPAGLADVLQAGSDLRDQLSVEGTALEGPVELLAVRTERDFAQTYHDWPLSTQLAPIAIDPPSGASLPAASVFDGADADALRALAGEGREYEPFVRVQAGDSAFYEVYVRDQVPSDWADAIEAFGVPF